MKEKHEMSKTTTYRSWQKMKGRCSSLNNDRYKDYGGRGIGYEPRWEKFSEFLKDMGERPKGTSLDRIDVNGNYCKENCRWATNQEQSNNTRNNVRLLYKGENKTISQWSLALNIPRHTIRSRYERGWDIERVFTQKVQKKSKPLTFRGETKTMTEWAYIHNIGLKTVSYRIRVLKWSVEKALLHPVMKEKGNEA